MLLVQGCLHQKTYRPHVGPASSVNMRKAKWQLIVAALIYNLSSYTKVYIGNWIALVFQTGQALPLIKPWHPYLCCLSCPALCITLTGCLLSPAGDSCVAHTAVRRVSPQGTCSGTWIRLAHHPVLPAPRLPSRVRLKRGAKAPELPVQAAASLYGPGAK